MKDWRVCWSDRGRKRVDHDSETEKCVKHLKTKIGADLCCNSVAFHGFKRRMFFLAEVGFLHQRLYLTDGFNL